MTQPGSIITSRTTNYQSLLEREERTSGTIDSSSGNPVYISDPNGAYADALAKRAAETDAASNPQLQQKDEDEATINMLKNTITLLAQAAASEGSFDEVLSSEMTKKLVNDSTNPGLKQAYKAYQEAPAGERKQAAAAKFLETAHAASIEDFKGLQSKLGKLSPEQIEGARQSILKGFDDAITRLEKSENPDAKKIELLKTHRATFAEMSEKIAQATSPADRALAFENSNPSFNDFIKVLHALLKAMREQHGQNGQLKVQASAAGAAINEQLASETVRASIATGAASIAGGVAAIGIAAGGVIQAGSAMNAYKNSAPTPAPSQSSPMAGAGVGNPGQTSSVIAVTNQNNPVVPGQHSNPTTAGQTSNSATGQSANSASAGSAPKDQAVADKAPDTQKTDAPKEVEKTATQLQKEKIAQEDRKAKLDAGMGKAQALGSMASATAIVSASGSLAAGFIEANKVRGQHLQEQTRLVQDNFNQSERDSEQEVKTTHDTIKNLQDTNDKALSAASGGR